MWVLSDWYFQTSAHAFGELGGGFAEKPSVLPALPRDTVRR
jgi:hypothetical protein